jgi:hypothetical protein
MSGERDRFFSQKAIPHNPLVAAQSPFHKQLIEKRKYGRLYQSVDGKNLPELHYDLLQTACG